MADSDDEFDRRNAREKFRPERNDYERRGDDRRAREPFDDNWGGRGRDRRGGDGFDRGRRDHFSPPRQDTSPPQVKRVRRDWEEGGGYPHYDVPVPYGALPPPPVAGGPPPPGWTPGGGDVPPPMPPAARGAGAEPELLTQPSMMTFKQFLNSQDDNITDDEAIKRFGEYKLDFRKQQINEFFVQHKDEEWFRCKYHPEEYDKRREEARSALLKRCQVFSKLLEMNRVTGVTVDADHSTDIVKLLDAAVILLEGGTEFDLKCLDDQTEETTVQRTQQNSATGACGDSKPDPDVPLKTNTEDADKTSPRLAEPVKPETDSSVVEQQDKPVKVKVKKPRRDSANGSESETGSLSDSDNETDSNITNNKTIPENSSVTEKQAAAQEVKDDDGSQDDGMEEGEERDEPKPRALHKTQSIFLRSLPALVTKQEVEEVCKRYPGFLRVAIQDPLPERKFLRRGWITFDNSVNVKEICWNLNNIRLRDSDIGAIVNRELKQRVRPVSGLTNHRSVARQDLRHAAKIAQILDERWSLWADNSDEKKDNEKESFSGTSHNPVLTGIAEFLVDEGSYEEDALLGGKMDDDKTKDASLEFVLERDDALLKALDKVILYLRVVHSLDYYSAIEYPREDEMPHRCGIIHARGSTPFRHITQTEVDELLASFGQRVQPLMNNKIFLDEAEMSRLGKKNPNDEVEKFILANTQELSKEKWLCPLSGKKFKGPDFVRKHIFAKHMEKVDEVKQEVQYFNNYLRDPRRPQLPEHTAAKPSTSTSTAAGSNTSGSSQPPAVREGYLPPTGAFHGPLPPPPHMGYRPPPVMYQGRRTAGPQFPNRGGGGPDHFRGGDFRRDRFPPRNRESRPAGARSDPRGVVNYNDLDAPPDAE